VKGHAHIHPDAAEVVKRAREYTLPLVEERGEGQWGEAEIVSLLSCKVKGYFELLPDSTMRDSRCTFFHHYR
jgi:hypothetical protein